MTATSTEIDKTLDAVSRHVLAIREAANRGLYRAAIRSALQAISRLTDAVEQLNTLSDQEDPR